MQISKTSVFKYLHNDLVLKEVCRLQIFEENLSVFSQDKDLFPFNCNCERKLGPHHRLWPYLKMSPHSI